MANKETNNSRYNQSGCIDLTAYHALNNVTDKDRLQIVLDALFTECKKQGFYVDGRITFVSKRTGRVYK